MYDTDSPGSELRSPAQKAMDRSALRSNPMFAGGDDDDDSIDADNLPMELSPEPPTPAPRVARAGSHPPLKTAAQNGGIVTKTCFLCGEMRRRRGSEAEGSRRSLLARRVRPADAQGRGRVRRRIQNGGGPRRPPG